MKTFSLSNHALEMMNERKICEEWIKITLEHPDKKIEDNSTCHYIRKLDECEGRYLRVIVNAKTNPLKVITVFFDRRLRRKQ